jgi:hypothetical protein
MLERLGELARETSVPGAVLGVWHEGELTVTPFRPRGSSGVKLLPLRGRSRKSGDG